MMKFVRYIAFTFLALALVHGYASTPHAATADETAVSFYRWYLHEIAHDQVPTDRMDGPIRKYVASKLRAELRKKLSKGDMEADYFLEAQDFLPDWEQNVTASKASTLGAVMVTEITLGKTTASRHRLSVSLTTEDQVWKIVSVKPLK